MKGRLYDPSLGQFLSSDPLLTEPASQGLNRFAYVDNSPLNYTDPSGFKSCALGFPCDAWEPQNAMWTTLGVVTVGGAAVGGAIALAKVVIPALGSVPPA